MTALYIIAGFLAIVVLLFLLTLVKLLAGRRKAAGELASASHEKFSNPGQVSQLSILPLIDYYAENENLKTEAGVSYLVKADDYTILMDMGLNAVSSHPSPLLQNMDRLGASMDDLNAIFISHVHLDHVGGMKDQKNSTFSPSAGNVAIPSVPVYAPEQVAPSTRVQADRMDVHIASEPVEITKGVYSMGAMPRFLYLMGHTLEHVLAVRLKGRGLVLIIGCGHPAIERIVERAKMLFDDPIYAVIGGLHYPVHGGRITLGPINLQRLVGSDRVPWNGLNEEDVFSAIEMLRKENPAVVSLSPHDSSDWTLERFKNAFGDRYTTIHVGRKILLT